MTEPLTNCGRCAHLWNRDANHQGFGRCACTARQEQTGQIRPLVELIATCEHAQLSAKYDPDFMPAVRLARRGGWDKPTIIDPPTPESHASKTGQDSL